MPKTIRNPSWGSRLRITASGNENLLGLPLPEPLTTQFSEWLVAQPSPQQVLGEKKTQVPALRQAGPEEWHMHLEGSESRVAAYPNVFLWLQTPAFSPMCPASKPRTSSQDAVSSDFGVLPGLQTGALRRKIQRGTKVALRGQHTRHSSPWARHGAAMGSSELSSGAAGLGAESQVQGLPGPGMLRRRKGGRGSSRPEAGGEEPLP